MKPLEEQLQTAQQESQPFLSGNAIAPLNVEQAYQIQRAAFCQGNQGLPAWKLGRLADNSVFCAPIYAVDIFHHADELPPRYHNACHVEAEIAFKLNRDIHLTDTVELSDIDHYFSHVCSAIEVLDSRFIDWKTADSYYHIADRQMNGAIALGDAQPITSIDEYLNQHFTLSINNKEVSCGENKHPEQDLRAALLGFIHRAQACGYTLNSDSWVTTGSWSGCLHTKRGDNIELLFNKLSQLSITL